MKKRDGKLEIYVSFFVIVVLAIILVSQLQMATFRATKTYVEDAMAASNLASAVIDIQEYGISHEIIISDTDQAYAYYLNALKSNLKLNNNWESTNKSIISGKVVVEEYRIYNVMENDVEMYIYYQNGSMSFVEYPNGLGIVRAPDGKLIENTSVYSRITFPIDAMWKIHVMARKENLVDITNR